MVDESQAPVTPVTAPAEGAVNATETPVISTESAPAAASPTSATLTDDGAKGAETAVVEPVEAPKVETPAAEVPVENVLDGAKPKEGEAKADEKKVEAEKDAKVETPTEVTLPTFEEFKLPEGVKLDKEPLDAFAKILGKIETSKLDHAGIQTLGQELVDLATKGTIDSITRLNDSYVQIHKDNINKRVTALKSDPVMGGENFQNTVSQLQDSIEQYGGSAEQIAEFRKEISEAGLGPSPAVCRVIYNMQKKIDAYTKEGSENRIVPGAKPAPEKVKPYQLFYTG